MTTTTAWAITTDHQGETLYYAGAASKRTGWSNWGSLDIAIRFCRSVDADAIMEVLVDDAAEYGEPLHCAAVCIEVAP